MKAHIYRVLGYGAYLLAGLAIVFDLVFPDRQTTGSPEAQSGFSLGVLIGVAIRTAVLVALGNAARRRAEDAADPAGRTSALRDLEVIAASRRTSIPETRPDEAARFEPMSDDELAGVYSRLDAHAHPERMRALLWVIHERTRRPASTLHEASGPSA